MKKNDSTALVRNRLIIVWRDVVASLWFVPAVIVAGLTVLAVITVSIDHALWESEAIDRGPSIFRGGVDGARGVLAAIAGSLIAAAATVFSITVVVLQLASSQFTPRVLRSFTADRRFQITLGLLLGTFVYSLLALWSVGREREDGVPFVPTTAVGVGILLALISVAVLIVFIQRVSSLIQVSVLIDRVARTTIDEVNTLYGDPVNDSAPRKPPAEIELSNSKTVNGDEAGYIRAIDDDALVALASEWSVTIAVTRQIGDFVLPSTEIAQVSPPRDHDSDLESAIQKTFSLGLNRMLDNDVDFGIQQIADIGIKSLSPGINDPTTAINCIDRLCEVLFEAGIRDAPAALRHGEQGGVLLMKKTPEFKRLLGHAFDQIRHYGAADVAVSSHLVTKLGELAFATPASLYTVIASQALLLVENCERAGMIPADFQRVTASAAWAFTVMKDESASPGSAGRP